MHNEQPPQEIIDWLDETREHLLNGEVIPGPGAPKSSYILTGYRADDTSKQWRALDAPV